MKSAHHVSKECLEASKSLGRMIADHKKYKESGDRRTVWYHGTSFDNWDAIQKDGVLYAEVGAGHCTYLADTIEEAACYGDVVLQVAYDPFTNPKQNNYVKDCWQMRVYEPIPVGDCVVLSETKEGK